MKTGGEGLPWGCLTQGSSPGSSLALPQERELLSIVLPLCGSLGAPAPCQGTSIAGLWHSSAYRASSPKGHVSRLGGGEQRFLAAACLPRAWRVRRGVLVLTPSLGKGAGAAAEHGWERLKRRAVLCRRGRSMPICTHPSNVAVCNLANKQQAAEAAVARILASDVLA